MPAPKFKTNRELLLDLLKDPDRKPLLRILYELILLFFTFKEVPIHYFTRYLFKKRATNFRDYVPNKYAGKIPRQFNDNKAKEVLDNKLFFDFFYSRYNISLPEILMYNHKNMFTYGTNSIEICNYYDFTALLKRIFGQLAPYSSIIIKKTWASSGGKKIYRLFENQVDKETGTVNEIYSEVIRSGYLFQETVKQHPDLNKLNSSCLNTMRIDTFMNSAGKIEIISAYLRMSISNSCIDNISSGGCQVGILLQTGRLKKYGYSLIKKVGVKVLTEHPVSGITFENFSIPFFREAKELVLRAASLNPALRLIGWDVAIGESGPILIEGNSDYDLTGNDLVDEGYFANATFRKVLHEIHLL